MAREMKNSGIEWIGEIPVGWETVRTKNCYSHRKQIAGDTADNYERLALTLNGVIKRPKNDATGLQPKEFNGYQVIRENELVFKLIDLENISTSRVGYSPYTGIVSPAYIVLHPRNDNESKFGEYYFLSMWQREIFNHMGDDGVRSSLNAGDLLNIPYLSIPDEEKKRIVLFLDQKCAEIDAVIEKTKATIEEYKKLKQSVITEAVTKGIRGNRPMKDSGIEWIGDIPVEWDIQKGKRILKRLERPVKENDGVITCFRDGEVTLRSNRREDGFTFSLQEAGYQGIEPGDLVVHGMDGFAGAIGISNSRGKATPVLNVMECTENKRYIMYYLRNMAYNGIFLALATGIRVRSCDTNWNKLKGLPYLVPSIKEQEAIADFIDEKSTEIDEVIAKKTTLLTELETYKKSLIYEYVTGKKEVGEDTASTQVAVYSSYFPITINSQKLFWVKMVLMAKTLEKFNYRSTRVKLQKTIFVIQNSIGFDLDNEYVREKYGPLDNSIFQCENAIKKRGWIKVTDKNGATNYKAGDNKKAYQKDYDRYFAKYDTEIDRIINIFKDYDAKKAERIATLFGAWNDAIIDKRQFTDEDIVEDVRNNWHEHKKEYKREEWLEDLEEMRKNNLIPKGYGKKTVIKKIRCKG